MSANFEKGAFREVPWHRLGKVTGELMTAQRALDESDLDFDPIKAPTFIRLPDGRLVENKESFAIVRSTDLKVIGPKVGARYKPVAPRDSLSMMDTLVDDGSAKYESFGTLNNGRRLFATMRIPDSIQVGGEDAVDVYLTLLDSYDGTSPLMVLVAPVVVVCTNTARMALGSALRQWNLRHTQSIDGKIAQARESLGLTYKYMEAFDLAANAMVEVPVSMSEAERLIREVFPGDAAEGSLFSETQSEVLALFQGSPNITDAVRNTQWGVYNAITEYADWFAPVARNSKRSNAERLTDAVWTGSAVATSDRALAIIRG